jgi:hypothetical protein
MHSRRKKAPPENGGPTFFSLSGAKKVSRHKRDRINGLCSKNPAPSKEKWRFRLSKKLRHFSVAAGTGVLVVQAFQPDIPDVRLESLTYSITPRRSHVCLAIFKRAQR